MKKRNLKLDAHGMPNEVVDILVDWRASPADVMIEVDKKLKEFGLKVTHIDAGGDEYMFNIEKPKK